MALLDSLHLLGCNLGVRHTPSIPLSRHALRMQTLGDFGLAGLIRVTERLKNTVVFLPKKVGRKMLAHTLLITTPRHAVGRLAQRSCDLFETINPPSRLDPDGSF